jgi:hypothetical protein
VKNDRDSPCRLPVAHASPASSIPPRFACHCWGVLPYSPPRMRVKRRVS